MLVRNERAEYENGILRFDRVEETNFLSRNARKVLESWCSKTTIVLTEFQQFDKK